MMRTGRLARVVVRGVLWSFGLGAAGYVAWVGVTWRRYGHMTPASSDADPLLDRFIPRYEVAERHQIRVNAPADATMAAAREMDLLAPAPVRVIIRAREVVLGSRSDERSHVGLVAFTQSIGWGLLAEVPGREIVMGAVTKPWEANVTFHPLAPDVFASFSDPDYAKIVWTLRAEPLSPTTSLFRTETRVTTTDAQARRKFRRYWSFVSPGIWLIRWFSLSPVKADAERRAASAQAADP